MRNILLLFLTLLFQSTAWPQPNSGSRTFHYNLKDGLSFGIVNSICQDNHGFMWFSTSDGLNRFDGNTFKVFKSEKDNPHSLSSNFIQSIFKDQKGTLWVSSRDGLNEYDPKTNQFINYRISNEPASSGINDVTHISQSRDGNLWVATGAGFYYFDIKTKKFRGYNHNSVKGLPQDIILNIYEDSQGKLWIGTRDYGFAIYEIKDGKQVGKKINFPDFLPRSRVNSFYEDSQNRMWVATSKGLVQYKRSENKFNVINGPDYKLSGNIFLSVVQNNKNDLLVGMQDGGLLKLNILMSDNNQKEVYSFETVKGENGATLTKRSVQSVFKDKDKNIWIGTYGNGLYMISSVNEKFKKYEAKQEDNSYIRFYGMCLDHEGNLWLGTDGNGLYKSTIEGKILKHYRADGQPGSIKDNAILTAFRDSKNRLWFGTYEKGLLLYNPHSDSFKSYGYSDADIQSLGANDVRVIFEDSGQHIWIGTNGGGLNLLDEKSGTFTRYNSSNSNISSNDIRAIVEDARGNLWLGIYGGGGLTYFDRRKQQFFKPFANSNKNIIRNSVVFALHLSRNGNLWIGTEGDGLLEYNTKSNHVRVYGEKSGLINNTVNAIKSENEEILWVSTNKGISKINVKTGSISNYDGGDGLQLGQFHEGSAVYDKKRAIMVFGGTEGWNIFKPKDVRPSQFHSKVLVTGLKLYGQPKQDEGSDAIQDITELKQVVLTPDQPVFSLNYVMLDYAYPSEGEFAYKLDGLDKEWNYVKNQRSATYRYLDPGTYTFKVKAANHDGIWSPGYTSIIVKVLPPWYKTWLAYMLYILSAVGAIYSYIRYRTEQAKLKYEIKSAHFEAEKEKELHNKKLDFFTSISHEFRTPLTLIINPLKEVLYEEGKKADVGMMNTVYRNARRLLSLVDQLLLFRKSESENDKLKIVKLNISIVCKEVFLCFTHHAKMQKVDLVFESTSDEVEVYADREKIEIALFNLVSNALKYTPQNGKVLISLSTTEDSAIIQVADTGPGIPQEVGERLFEQFYQVGNINSQSKGGFGIGLFLVKNYIELHKGTVTYTSKPGEGTTFTINLLRGKNHLNANVIFEEVTEPSVFLEELIEDVELAAVIPESAGTENDMSHDLYTEIKTILIIDDNNQIRQYIKQLFSKDFEVLESDNGLDGLEMIKRHLPDIVISDVMMQGLSGVELCVRIKEDPSLNHIPIILLTASASLEVKLKGIECGADDFISKPFEKEILIARVSGILKSRNNLQKYFYNQITLQPNSTKISSEYKEFLDKCILIVEEHLLEDNFGIKKFTEKLGMSRSKLYLRIKSVSGQSASAFIRSIRLRKAAEIFISTNCTVSEAAYMVGINDVKYFREQFNKLFGMNPSEYIKKYRKNFNESHSIKKEIKPKNK